MIERVSFEFILLGHNKYHLRQLFSNATDNGKFESMKSISNKDSITIQLIYKEDI